jgi:hypothetical protein
MKRTDATEGADIVDRMMQNLAAIVASSGRTGASARTAINDVRVNAFFLLMDNAIGQPMADAFEKARVSGCTLPAIISVRQQIELEETKTPGGTLVRDTGINFCLAIEGKIIAGMRFVSRQDVETLKANIAPSFASAEEIAADAMDSQTYMALVALHAAINNHLVQTALPLPLMLNFQFFEPLPSLVMAYRLYGDASRADEIRSENKIVHPAFCPPMGQALAV